MLKFGRAQVERLAFSIQIYPRRARPCRLSVPCISSPSPHAASTSFPLVSTFIFTLSSPSHVSVHLITYAVGAPRLIYSTLRGRHLRTALLPSVEHATFNSNHEQLRPRVQNYDLSIDSRNGIRSLAGCVPLRTLGLALRPLNLWGLVVQRRMHPLISRDIGGIDLS
jgi:hypothetical protein